MYAHVNDINLQRIGIYATGGNLILKSIGNS